MQSSKSKKIDNLLTSPERPKSQQQQEPIKKLIEIEICKNCSIHEWCTRHDEKKYKEQLEEVKKAIKTSCPDVEVIQSKIAQPRLGAFEILHGAKALFSKCKSGLWPHPPAIAQRVQLYFEDLLAGKDVSKYGNEKEVMYSPPKKKKDPMSSTHVTEFGLYKFRQSHQLNSGTLKGNTSQGPSDTSPAVNKEKITEKEKEKIAPESRMQTENAEESLAHDNHNHSHHMEEEEVNHDDHHIHSTEKIASPEKPHKSDLIAKPDKLTKEPSKTENSSKPEIAGSPTKSPEKQLSQIQTSPEKPKENIAAEPLKAAVVAVEIKCKEKHPMTKIQALPADIYPNNEFKCAKCSAEKVSAKDGVYHCDKCKQYDICMSCANKKSEKTSIKTCPKNHELKKGGDELKAMLKCNKCNTRREPSKSKIYYCDECKYFICLHCKDNHTYTLNHDLAGSSKNPKYKENTYVCDVCLIDYECTTKEGAYHCETCSYDVCPNCHKDLANATD